MTPEGKIKKKVTALLKLHNAYYFMPVQHGYGRVSLDYLICHRGRFAAVETKAPGKKPTPLQEVTIEEIRNVGGRVFVIDGDLQELEDWLNT